MIEMKVPQKVLTFHDDIQITSNFGVMLILSVSKNEISSV